jgi:hypothetical protein
LMHLLTKFVHSACKLGVSNFRGSDIPPGPLLSPVTATLHFRYPLIAVSNALSCAKLFFRPFGAGPFPTYTQGLRPGLHFFAAARLLLVRFSPSARVNFEFCNSLKARKAGRRTEASPPT